MESFGVPLTDLRIEPLDYIPILALGMLCALLGIAIMRGVTLTEEDQLDPEQSTSALVILHPKAKYFSV